MTPNNGRCPGYIPSQMYQILDTREVEDVIRTRYSGSIKAVQATRQALHRGFVNMRTFSRYYDQDSTKHVVCACQDTSKYYRTRITPTHKIAYRQVLSAGHNMQSLPSPAKSVSPITWPTDMEVRILSKCNVQKPDLSSHWASSKSLIAYRPSIAGVLSHDRKWYH